MPEHTFEIRGERFRCPDERSAWSLLKLAKSQTSKEDNAALVGMYDFVMETVVHEERERLDAFLSDAAVSFDELNQAIGALMTSYTDRPTEPPLPSPPGPNQTADGPRVVSLSPRGKTQSA